MITDHSESNVSMQSLRGAMILLKPSKPLSIILDLHRATDSSSHLGSVTGTLWFHFLQDLSASLCFRGQRIFLHNASGWFGNVPLEASGDFGINSEEGEFHLMCQVYSSKPSSSGLGLVSFNTSLFNLI